MVLVSYQERGIQGVNWGLGGESKNRLLSLCPFFIFISASAEKQFDGYQVDGKIPKDLALTTAFVRLLTPSLPLIFRGCTLTVFNEM